MIYIEKDSQVVLPEKYHVGHNLCVFIYEMIVDIHKNSQFKPLFKSEFSFLNEGKLLRTDDLVEDRLHALEWLVENEKYDKVEEIICKRLLTSISGDLLNFIYEGLSCSMRGKTTVAYANFRKPLKDSLTILEMMLVDPSSFTKKFYIDGSPSGYDPSDRKLNKKELIDKALKKLEGVKVFNTEIIHQLRFDKSNSNSFDAVSNKALHIVTRDKNYATEEKGLNFVFSSKEDIESQWDHIYLFLPVLLSYALSVIDELIFTLTDLDKEIKKYRSINILLKTMYWTCVSDNFSGRDEVLAVLKRLGDCDNCGKKIKFDIHDLRLFFETDLILCPSCFESQIGYPEGYIPSWFEDDQIYEEE